MSTLKVHFTGKLLNYQDYRKYSDTFIETGTAAGDGVQRALAAGFKNIVSFEAAEQWYKQSVDRFCLNKNVLIVHDKSTVGLLGLCGERSFYKMAMVFYLDAHPAGPLSAGHADWLANPNGEANQHNIIQAELKIILSHRKDHVIIIDDVNGMADGCASVYMDMCLAVNHDYRFEFWDENLSGNLLYTNKILVCLP